MYWKGGFCAEKCVRGWRVPVAEGELEEVETVKWYPPGFEPYLVLASASWLAVTGR